MLALFYKIFQISGYKRLVLTVVETQKATSAFVMLEASSQSLANVKGSLHSDDSMHLLIKSKTISLVVPNRLLVIKTRACVY